MESTTPPLTPPAAPPRPFFQIRRRDSGDPRFYAPNRDVAYIGPRLIVQALQVLHPDHRTRNAPWTQQLLAAVTDEQVAQMLAVVEKLFLSMRDADIANAAAALQASGWYQLTPEVQTLLVARLGFLVLGAIFTGIRDVSTPGTANASLEEVVQSTHQLAALLECPPAPAASS